MAKITIQVDQTPVIINEQDYEDVIKYSWHLRYGRPRAKIYIQSSIPNITSHAHQIPLDRFVLNLTPFNNVKIIHPFDDQLQCDRNDLFTTKKDVSKSSKYNGVVQQRNGFVAVVLGNSYGPFIYELDAAKRYDAELIKAVGWRAKTNFYQNLRSECQ
jgi:hypothetical protein